MAKASEHPDYPSVYPYSDRHGKTRWRFRRSGTDKSLPGEPHSPAFDAAYNAIVLGRPTTAEIIPLEGGGFRPKTLKHAYQILKSSKQWLALSSKSRHRYGREIERLLLRREKGGRATVGDGPLEELERNSVERLLSAWDDTPHMQRIIVICVQKLILVGIKQGWIRYDVTYKMLAEYQPETDGHPAWTAEQMMQYEAHHKLGSPARVAYALALWLGLRVSDIARLRWSQLVTKYIEIDGEDRVVTGFEFEQFKGRKKRKLKKMFLPISPILEAELAPVSRDCDYLVTYTRGGKKMHGYTDNSLSNRMIDWAQEAGLPTGEDAGDDALSGHGLRKSLGNVMAEAGVTDRQMVDIFGHANANLIKLYSRSADQVRLAVQGMDKVIAATEKKQRLRVVK
jgi:integrase